MIRPFLLRRIDSSPLPLAGEADAQSAAGGGSLRELQHPLCGNTPTPTLPRKREREKIYAAASFFGGKRP